MLPKEVNNFLDRHKLSGPNFEETGRRVNKMWNDFFSYPPPILTQFPITSKAGMVILKNFDDWGFCPHHLLPVKYTFKIGYIPKDFVLGASKPLRIASYLLLSMPLQEDLGEMIAAMIEKTISPRGVGVVINGEHHCMRIRGVESACTNMVTTYMSGCFLNEQSTREEFLLL